MLPKLFGQESRALDEAAEEPTDDDRLHSPVRANPRERGPDRADSATRCQCSQQQRSEYDAEQTRSPCFERRSRLCHSA